MLVHIYPDDEPMQLKALEHDQRRFAIALYQGKERNGDTYEVIPANLEVFKRLAKQHGCTVLSDF